MESKRFKRRSPARRVLDAAFEIIAHEKISLTRMRQIAKRAGVSQGNLHYYFPSNRDLFAALLDDTLQTFGEDRESMLANSRLSPPEKLQLFLNQIRQILEKRKKQLTAFHEFWGQGTGRPEMRGMIQRIYRR